MGLGAFQLAGILAFFDLHLAAVPLALFVALSLAAPFLQRLHYYVPIARRGRRDFPAAAITFDDGPDPVATPRLLDLLDKHRTKATFFVIGEKASRHPEIVRDILSRGHEIGNHSLSHLVFLMLHRRRVLRKEIDGCQSALAPFGIRPLAFRPPVGITNPLLFEILAKLGMYCAGFSCRGTDFGNRRITGLARKVLARLRPGDVLMLHDVLPKRGVTVESWLSEIEAILEGMAKRGLGTVPLSGVIRRPVMEPIEPMEPVKAGAGGNLVRTFYNCLADTYDAEQEKACQAYLRREELNLVLEKLPRMMGKTASVLELGAGSGRFTRHIAERAGSVLAVDLSGRMLDILRTKIEKAGLRNVETCENDIAHLTVGGEFDFICSFSCLEYVADLEGLLRRVNALLKPGGTIYFTIAHRSLIRFFTQIGNAMRQGIWLHARSRREMWRMLKTAGFSEVAIETHVLKSVVSGGVLMEAAARKSVVE